MSNIENQESRYKSISINKVHVGQEHIRKSSTDVSGLKNTIADVGLLQPILVRRCGDDFAVIDGARRLEALNALNVPELILGRDIIIDLEETEADTRFKEIIANVQREDLNDVELGHALIALKERYGYQYNEIAEIICKTPHYVAAKVGLAKRLTHEMQEMVVREMQAVKYIQNTSEGPAYEMNVNIIEDIARLPENLQKPAYELIKEGEMNKKEALEYLRSIKHDADMIRMADDVKGIMKTYADAGEPRMSLDKDLRKYLIKIDRDLERF